MSFIHVRFHLQSAGFKISNQRQMVGRAYNMGRQFQQTPFGASLLVSCFENIHSCTYGVEPEYSVNRQSRPVRTARARASRAKWIANSVAVMLHVLANGPYDPDQMEYETIVQISRLSSPISENKKIEILLQEM